jgi:hypothetical protein
MTVEWVRPNSRFVPIGAQDGMRQVSDAGCQQWLPRAGLTTTSAFRLDEEIGRIVQPMVLGLAEKANVARLLGDGVVVATRRGIGSRNRVLTDCVRHGLFGRLRAWGCVCAVGGRAAAQALENVEVGSCAFGHEWESEELTSRRRGQPRGS